MGPWHRRKVKPDPVDGRPSKGGRKETGSGARSSGKRGRKKKYRHFTPEERRAAIEAFQKSGMTQIDFCKVWGISKASLRNWLIRYEGGGATSGVMLKKTRQESHSSLVGQRRAPSESWIGLFFAGPTIPLGSRVGVLQVSPPSPDVVSMPHHSRGDGPTL